MFAEASVCKAVIEHMALTLRYRSQAEWAVFYVVSVDDLSC